jgi:putative transposase
MSEKCKTLEAYLAPPTQHKQRKLHVDHDRYESLLRRSFNNGCDTMSAVNEVVSGEALNWHAKNALKQYVPHLLDEDTYDAKQLADAHPIRYANTAAVFDIDEDRHHEICWEVPLPGRGRTSGYHSS